MSLASALAAVFSVAIRQCRSLYQNLVVIEPYQSHQVHSNDTKDYSIARTPLVYIHYGVKRSASTVDHTSADVSSDQL